MVNFNEDNYIVAESAGKVSVSLRIDGPYFVPVWAIVQIMDGTATGGLYKTCTSAKYCAPGVDNLCACFAQASV